MRTYLLQNDKNNSPQYKEWNKYFRSLYSGVEGLINWQFNYNPDWVIKEKVTPLEIYESKEITENSETIIEVRDLLGKIYFPDEELLYHQGFVVNNATDCYISVIPREEVIAQCNLYEGKYCMTLSTWYTFTRLVTKTSTTSLLYKPVDNSSEDSYSFISGDSQSGDILWKSYYGPENSNNNDDIYRLSNNTSASDTPSATMMTFDNLLFRPVSGSGGGISLIAQKSLFYPIQRECTIFRAKQKDTSSDYIVNPRDFIQYSISTQSLPKIVCKDGKYIFKYDKNSTTSSSIVIFNPYPGFSRFHIDDQYRDWCPKESSFWSINSFDYTSDGLSKNIESDTGNVWTDEEVIMGEVYWVSEDGYEDFYIDKTISTTVLNFDKKDYFYYNLSIKEKTTNDIPLKVLLW